MLNPEKLDFTGFYKFENEQKLQFFYDFFSSESVGIIILDYVLNSENRIHIKDFNRLFRFNTRARSSFAHRECSKAFGKILTACDCRPD